VGSPSRGVFAVVRERGATWDPSRPMEEQELWPEHAAFMNGLAADGFVRLGGPLGDGERILLVIHVEDAEAVRARLAADPWSENGLLAIASVEPWTIRLEGPAPEVGYRPT
jgi:uncharacterized protein YciI